MKNFNKYLAEVLGTFAIVFFGTGAIIVNAHEIGLLGIALAFGLVVMAMIYAFCNISGAHFNPAVTIALTAAKKFKVTQVLPYILSQTVGALLASLLLKVLFPASDTLGATLPAGSEMQSFALEFILTFFLMLVILMVAFGTREQEMFAGLVIGAVIIFEILFAGPISGVSLNPVRSVAPALISGHLEHLWLYIVAPIGGMISAVFVWRLSFDKLSSPKNRQED